MTASRISPRLSGRIPGDVIPSDSVLFVGWVVLIFWLEDDSENFVETRAFVQRRINDVMTVERVKGTIKQLPILGDIVEHFESLAGGLLKRKESFPAWQSK